MLEPVVEAALPAAVTVTPGASTDDMAEACGNCGTEYMIGARFCHACGSRRPKIVHRDAHAGLAVFWKHGIARAGSWVVSATAALRKISFPDWLRYLHFHEIKRWVGLPTASLIAFIIGLGCVAGAIGVSLFYKASNLAEFQAIQMWRIEWLLAATASFVAGILLKKPSDSDAK